MLAPDDPDVLGDDLAFLLARRPTLLVISRRPGHDARRPDRRDGRRVTGRALAADPEALRMVTETTRRVAARRGLALDELLPAMARQALLPRGSRAIAPAGVAPGFSLSHKAPPSWRCPACRGSSRRCGPACSPPGRRGRCATAPHADHPPHGWGEVQVAALLGEAATDRLRLAITAADGEVTVTAGYDDDQAAAAQADALAAALRAAAPVFSSDGRTIDEIVADLLRGSASTVATAESCTGGLLGGRLTELPGSSDYFLGGAWSTPTPPSATCWACPPTC